MAFESLTKNIQRSGRMRGHGHPAKLTIVGIKGIKSPRGEMYSRSRLLFRVHYDLWTQAEMEPGQKVEVLFDRSQMIAMIQPSDSGYSLTPHAQKWNEEYDVTFLIPHDEKTGFPYFEGQTGMEDLEVKDGCIYFRVPPTGDLNLKSLGKAHQGNGEFQQKQKRKGAQ